MSKLKAYLQEKIKDYQNRKEFLKPDIEYSFKQIINKCEFALQGITVDNLDYVIAQVKVLKTAAAMYKSHDQKIKQYQEDIKKGAGYEE